MNRAHRGSFLPTLEIEPLVSRSHDLAEFIGLIAKHLNKPCDLSFQFQYRGCLPRRRRFLNQGDVEHGDQRERRGSLVSQTGCV